MILSQTIQIAILLISSRFGYTVIRARWAAAALAVGLMIMIGAIKTEAAHAFTVESHDHGEYMVREREVRHAEPELGDGFRHHTVAGEF